MLPTSLLLASYHVRLVLPCLYVWFLKAITRVSMVHSSGKVQLNRELPTPFPCMSGVLPCIGCPSFHTCSSNLDILAVCSVVSIHCSRDKSLLVCIFFFFFLFCGWGGGGGGGGGEHVSRSG